MKRIIAAMCMVALAGCGGQTASGQEPSLKEGLKGKFHIGTALNTTYIWERDPKANELIKYQFDAIVAENCMKSGLLQPREGEFFWDDADRLVEYGEKNGMWITGHCLIWHSQTPGWFFTDANGDEVSREVLLQRMKTHIYTVVGRYKGRIKGWDVVNEAIMEDGSMRNSRFRQIIGDDFMKYAFQYAHEADPDCELYYNDYNEWYPGKRDAVVKFIKSLKDAGIRIDGVGMQGHISMTSPTIEEYQATIDQYAAAGVKVLVTELDMSALPTGGRRQSANLADTQAYEDAMNPYTQGLPDSVSAVWTKRMGEIFKLFLDNSDDITRVTFWGVTDETSWKNGFPIRGRTDYALPFDRNYQAKPVVEEIVKMAKKK